MQVRQAPFASGFRAVRETVRVGAAAGRRKRIGSLFASPGRNIMRLRSVLVARAA